MMKTHFADNLVAAIKKKGSPICVGLDPRIDQIPDFIRDDSIARKGRTIEAVADAFVTFNKGIIDATYDLVPVVKPQFAFYVQYGAAGVAAFAETCKYAKEKGLIVIADAKSNDIGSTAEAYANGFLSDVDVFGEKVSSPINCDALTVNAYLGYDGIKPFTEACRKKGKGIFVLVKTSNPSSGDFQDRVTTDDGLANYELMAHFLDSWGSDDVGESGYSSIGAVVGATFPDQAKKLRKLMPQTYFLVPGYGKQGGKAADVKECFNADGKGALISSSREIIFAWKEEGDEKAYGDLARDVVLKMKSDLTKIL